RGAVCVAAALELGLRGVDLAVEEAHRGRHLFGVCRVGGAGRARRRAGADLALQTGCGLGRGLQAPAAGAQPEQLGQERLRFDGGGAAAKRTEVAPAAASETANDGETCEAVAGGQLEERDLR